MPVWPNLLGDALLMRQWGRIGTDGRRRLDLYPDTGAALNALAALARANGDASMWIDEGEPRKTIRQVVIKTRNTGIAN